MRRKLVRLACLNPKAIDPKFMSEDIAFIIVCHHPHYIRLIPSIYQSLRVWAKVVQKRPREIMRCTNKPIRNILLPRVLLGYGSLYVNMDLPSEYLPYAVKNMPKLILEGSKPCPYITSRPRGDVTKAMITYAMQRGCQIPDRLLRYERDISCEDLDIHFDTIIEAFIYHTFEDQTTVIPSVNGIDEIQKAYNRFLEAPRTTPLMAVDIFETVVARMDDNAINFLGLPSKVAHRGSLFISRNTHVISFIKEPKWVYKALFKYPYLIKYVTDPVVRAGLKTYVKTI